MNFKIGDKVTTNPIYNEKFKHKDWWQKYKNSVMTIKRIGDYVCSVEENNCGWPYGWIIKFEENFFKEDEFII